MRRPPTQLVVLTVVLALLLAACTAGVNPQVGTTAEEASRPAGLLLGLWHGIIAPVTFFISLLTDDINVYEVHNNGNWYDFGFVIGAGILFGGSHGARRRR